MHTYCLTALIVYFILTCFFSNICISELCPGKDIIPCPGSGGGCLPKISMCDGTNTCQDGADENEEFCSKWPCEKGGI